MNPDSSQAALAQLQQQQATAQDPNTILANQRQQLGVNAAQDTVTGLRGAINNTTKLLQQVAPGVMGRTGNSLVTSAQANRIIQNEQAPIQQDLSNQGTQYNQATEDLGTLSQRASDAANGIYQGQQDKLSYLQNLYNSMYQREQDAAQAAFQQQQFEYQKQKDAADRAASLAAARSSGGSSDASSGLGSTISALLGGSGGGSSLKQNGNGTFSFTNSNGQPISAAAYSQLKGIPFRTLLQQMASAGDGGAKQALNFVGDDYGYDPSKVNASLYNALVWGTGRGA